jgi:hypothetical protein
MVRDPLILDCWFWDDRDVHAFVAQDFNAYLHALVADVDVRPGNQFPHFRLRFTTEIAAEDIGLGRLTAQGFFLRRRDAFSQRDKRWS